MTMPSYAGWLRVATRSDVAYSRNLPTSSSTRVSFTTILSPPHLPLEHDNALTSNNGFKLAKCAYILLISSHDNGHYYVDMLVCLKLAEDGKCLCLFLEPFTAPFNLGVLQSFNFGVP